MFCRLCFVLAQSINIIQKTNQQVKGTSSINFGFLFFLDQFLRLARWNYRTMQTELHSIIHIMLNFKTSQSFRFIIITKLIFSFWIHFC